MPRLLTFAVLFLAATHTADMSVVTSAEKLQVLAEGMDKLIREAMDKVTQAESDKREELRR